MDAVVEDAGVGSGGEASGLEEEGHETITMGDMHTCEKYIIYNKLGARLISFDYFE